MTRFIGITSTVPVEVVYASGAVPVDLNNAFITSADPYAIVESAEADGFPRNYCAWMKGVYGVLSTRPEIDTIIGVMQGDCGNTAALMDVIASEGRRVIPFAYPSGREINQIEAEIGRLAKKLGVSLEKAETVRKDFAAVRALAARIDESTWREENITGEENHFALIGMSDFDGDPAAYENSLSILLAEAGSRRVEPSAVRLGYVGVPPITSDFYEIARSRGASVVYNEVQREFSMPRPSDGLAAQYAGYTYPYGAIARAGEIGAQVRLREIHGLVHYVQSFCYHQLDDLVFRDLLGVPVLRLEADKPGALDERARLRLEAFIETLGGQ